jgi:hypothetical protein
VLTYRLSGLRETRERGVGNAYASTRESGQGDFNSGTLHGRIQENELKAHSTEARKYIYTVYSSY